MSKLLVVVDYQKDFVDGALGYPGAETLEGPLCDKVKAALADGWKVIFTRDAHAPDYLDTREGRNLPVPHCIRGTQGWALDARITEALEKKTHRIIEKPTFGSTQLPHLIHSELQPDEALSIELVGLCTDICVVSNALILKAAFPEADVRVNPDLCAGSTPENHAAALQTLRSCQAGSAR